MSDKYIPVPAITPDRPNENMVRNFLAECCCWRESQDSDKYLLFEAFKNWAWAKGFSPISPSYVEAELRRMGHNIGNRYILGIFLRPEAATVPVASSQSGYAASEKLQGGAAAVSIPSAMPILPTDTPEVRAQKIAYNKQLEPELPQEVVFVSARGVM